MSKDIIYFAEDVCGLKLPKWQKEMLLQLYETYKKGGHLVINGYRHQGKQLLQNILINYELWSKDQQIAELEEQLKNAIVPKFKFMEKVWHINKDYFYKKDWCVEELLINGFEYKIDKRKNALVMWYSTYFNDYKNYKYQEKDLFATKEEAQAKLEELRGENK